MSMISPVRSDYTDFGKRSGRPVGERTLEILGELKVAFAIGRYMVTLPLLEDEVGKSSRFSQRARHAAKMGGYKVRVRKLDDIGEITFLSE